MTQDDVRRLVATLPGSSERPSYGTPGFRVKDRLFARITDGAGVELVDHPPSTTTCDVRSPSASAARGS